MPVVCQIPIGGGNKNLKGVHMNDFNHISKHELHKAVASLEDHKTEAIILRYWSNMTIEEISKIMRISWAQANQLIEAALLELKKILQTPIEYKQAS